MDLDSSGVSTAQRVVLLVAGVLLGSLFISPSAAHVTDSILHLKQHLDAEYVETVGNLKLFAVLQGEAGGGIAASAGPVTAAVREGTGVYRIEFARAPVQFSDEIVANVSATHVSGNTCAWSYTSSATQIRVRCHTPSGAAGDAVYSLVVWERG